MVCCVSGDAACKLFLLTLGPEAFTVSLSSWGAAGGDAAVRGGAIKSKSASIKAPKALLTDVYLSGTPARRLRLC